MTAAVAADANAATVVDLTRAVLAAGDIGALSAGAELQAGRPMIWVQLGLRVWKLSDVEALDALEDVLFAALRSPNKRAALQAFFREVTAAYLAALDLAAAHAVRGAH